MKPNFLFVGLNLNTIVQEKAPETEPCERLLPPRQKKSRWGSLTSTSI